MKKPIINMILGGAKVEHSTEPAFLPNCCYALGLFINEF